MYLEKGQLLLAIRKWFFSMVILHVANKSSINATETMLQLQKSVASKRMQICQLKVHFKFSSFKEDADMSTETALEVLHLFKPTRGKSVVSKITPTLSFKLTRNETQQISDNHNFAVAAFYNVCKNAFLLGRHDGRKLQQLVEPNDSP
ncbi:hypothetical protein Tco_1297814 [Tanacetum coccineum]